jgi:exosortase/archaeosortase family protein
MISTVGKLDKSIRLFVLKFLFYFILFYGLSYAAIALSVSGGYYIPFIEKHFNYVSGLRRLLVNVARYIASGFGYTCHVSGYTLYVNGGVGVHVGVSCAGIGLISFWWAFVLAFPQTLKMKLAYLTIGSAVIMLLNVIRVAGLAIVYTRYGRQTVDHHLLFNIVAYAVLLLMIIKSIDYAEKMRQIENDRTP